MAADLSKSGPGGPRPLRIRPHWWAVLAVSLSLLALVAATTSSQNGPDLHRAALATPNGRHTTPATTSTTTTVPNPGSGSTSLVPPAPAPVTTTVTLPVAVGRTAQVVTRQSVAAAAPTTTTTTATTTATTTPSGSTVGTAPAQPTTTIITGDLQQPDDATNSYTFIGAGSMRITATWPTSPTLSLTVACPGGTQTAEGSTAVTVLLADTNGTCAVTLKEMLVQYDAVSYRLTIAPAGG